MFNAGKLGPDNCLVGAGGLPGGRDDPLIAGFRFVDLFIGNALDHPMDYLVLLADLLGLKLALLGDGDTPVLLNLPSEAEYLLLTDLLGLVLLGLFI